MTGRILVSAELHKGEFSPVVAELLSEATKLKPAIGSEIQAVVLAGTEGLPRLSLLSEHGADTILICRDSSFNECKAEGYVQVMADAIGRYKPRLVLAGETPVGGQLARRLSARLGTSFVPDFIRIQVIGNSLAATRLIYNGKVGATVTALREPLVATLKPGVVRVRKPRTPGAGKVEELVVTPLPCQKRVEVLKHLAADPESMELNQADIVIGAGKGVGSADCFALLQEFARILKAGVGGTRRALDMGWVSPEDLIGQTGKIISPRLYIAVGVSGASHHIAGIRDAGLKIAINTDRNAPIFTVSDLGIVGDVRQVLPALVSAIKAVTRDDRSEVSKVRPLQYPDTDITHNTGFGHANSGLH